MLYSVLKLVHLLSIIVWVGGMVFAHFFLRPAVAGTLESLAGRIRLMDAVLQRFFAAVSVSVVLVVGSGVWMIGHMARMAAQTGGRFSMPLSWTIMATLGLVMAAIFGHIRLALFKRLHHATQTSDWPKAGKALASIRTWVGINLAIGLVTMVVALLV